MEAYGSTPVKAATLEERIASLESAFEEVKKLKGIPGSRGPAGPIDAAVNQSTKEANQAVRDAEARVKEVATEAFKRFTEEIAKLQKLAEDLRKEVNAHLKDIQGLIHNEVDGQVVQTLKDYLLLDANGEPAHWRNTSLLISK